MRVEKGFSKHLYMGFDVKKSRVWRESTGARVFIKLHFDPRILAYLEAFTQNLSDVLFLADLSSPLFALRQIFHKAIQKKATLMLDYSVSDVNTCVLEDSCIPNFKKKKDHTGMQRDIRSISGWKSIRYVTHHSHELIFYYVAYCCPLLPDFATSSKSVPHLFSLIHWLPVGYVRIFALWVCLLFHFRALCVSDVCYRLVTEDTHRVSSKHRCMSRYLIDRIFRKERIFTRY